MTVEVRTQSETQTRRRSPGRPRRTMPARDAHGARVEPGTPSRSESSHAPLVMTVYRVPEGKLHHTRCQRAIDFVGVRGGIEFDFYCLTCREHVTLTEGALSRIPEGPATSN